MAALCRVRREDASSLRTRPRPVAPKGSRLAVYEVALRERGANADDDAGVWQHLVFAWKCSASPFRTSNAAVCSGVARRAPPGTSHHH